MKYPFSLGFVLLVLPVQMIGQAKYEPNAGCYIGAFIQNDPSLSNTQYPYGDIQKFENATRSHALYLTYNGYGQGFLSPLVSFYNSHNAIIQIGYEPNQGLSVVSDSSYLRSWARAARRSGAMIFLRWASEMNGNWVAWFGNPSLYKEKWKLVWKVMKEEAPNVAMVWTPNDVPFDTTPGSVYNPDSYYPGDEYVDWVGVDFYCVYYYENGQPERIDPRNKLKVIYDRYADRKPIMISEWGVANNTTRGDTTGIRNYTIQMLDSLYRNLQTQFPKVKAVTYFDYNSSTVDWKITNDSSLLRGYRQAVSSSYFLGIADRNVPNVVLSGISDDTLLTQPVQIFVSVVSSSAVDSVVIAIDSLPAAVLTQAPYQYTITPVSLTQGRHVVRTTAYAHSGFCNFDERIFIVDNRNEYVNIIMDNDTPGFSMTGVWSVSTSQPDRYGTNYRFTNGGDGGYKGIWKPVIARSGEYRVYAWWSVASNRGTNVPYTIAHRNGTTILRVNQQLNGGQWNYFGTFTFRQGSLDSLYVSNEAPTNNVVIADAARFEWAFSPTNVPTQTKKMPEEFVLEQNYPNPFNPATTIRYKVPKTSLVTLEIYDILGRSVASPVTELLTPGEYMYTLKNASIPGGVYFYRLTAGNFSSTKKMLLLK